MIDDSKTSKYVPREHTTDTFEVVDYETNANDDEELEIESMLSEWEKVNAVLRWEISQRRETYSA